MRYIKLLLFLIIPFVLTACFIPERRIYFSWNRPIIKKDPCNYDFNTSSNINLIETERGYLMEFAGHEIYYRLGETKPYNIKDYVFVMDEVLSFMGNNRNCILLIEGHADIIGSNNTTINYNLSERRASVIRDVILSSGFSYKRVHIFPYSDIMPKYTTNIHLNRRVDFVAIKCENELEKYMKFYSNYGVNNTSNDFKEK